MKRAIRSCSFQTRVLVVASLLLVLLFNLPSCNNTGVKTSNIPSLTKPTTQPTGSIPSSTQSPTKLNGSIPSTTRPTPVIPDMSGRITEMLKVIPDVSSVFYTRIYYIDFIAWCQALGINLDRYKTLNGNPVAEDENNYVNDLVLSPSDMGNTHRLVWYPWLGWPPFISGMGSDLNWNMYKKIIEQSPIRKENTGFGPLDVERSIFSWALIEDVPFTYEAINGIFNMNTIGQTTSMYGDSDFRPQLSTYNGIDIYSWDGEMNAERSLAPPIFDMGGQGRTLAVQPHYIFGSTQAKRVDQMVDAYLGKMASLADNARYQGITDKLEKLGAMSAVISIKVLKPDYWVDEQDASEVNKIEFFDLAASYAPVMGPYTAFASGLGMDEQGLFVTLVLTYDSQELAKRDVETLKKRLAAGYNSEATPWQKEVDSSIVWADGTALCAKLRGNVTDYWDCFLLEEPLLVREN